MTENDTRVDERSLALAGALTTALDRRAFPLHTGGGVYVMCVELDNDRPGSGRQVWLTREQDADGRDEWMLGFYDLVKDDCDEGVCVKLMTLGQDDDVTAVARAVAGILTRLRVLS